MKKTILAALLTITFVMLTSCGKIKINTEPAETGAENVQEAEVPEDVPQEESTQADVSQDDMLTEDAPQDDMPQDDMPQDDISQNDVTPEEPVDFLFRDVHGVEYSVELHPDWPYHEYDNTRYAHDGYKVSYEDENYTYRLGVDVSSYQKEIDWKQVAGDGYSFAIVRIGFRGYGSVGNIVEDKYGVANLHNAMAAGLDCGVYFFAQAISVEEAVEEAEFVLGILSREGVGPEQLTMPIVYDPETIDKPDARTKDMTGEQLTANALAFCATIQAAGYQPMVYSNMLWEAYNLDLGQLSQAGIPIWYADYEDVPQTPYDYVMWQYSERSRVDGIKGGMDTNIQLIRK